MFDEHLSEGSPSWIGDALDHEIESSRSHSDGSHAVVDPSWTQSSLDDLESSSETSHDVGERNPDVGVGDLAVTLKLDPNKTNERQSRSRLGS